MTTTMATTGRWSEVDAAAYETALRCARGCYQVGVIDGNEALSGSTLRGAAARYGFWYARSRANLLARCRAAGLAVSERIAERGRRVLVIGVSASLSA